MFNHIYMFNLQQARENPDLLGKTCLMSCGVGTAGRAGLLCRFTCRHHERYGHQKAVPRSLVDQGTNASEAAWRKS